ncbi:MAG: glycosyltransferase family 4 protein [Planctomycetes bacterium]|nr:glycosyltransferase family 4 protein [Planctomycetota bacterium]
MRIALLVPGTGNWYCGSCLRDNTLARALREQGHDAQVIPLYLPFQLEDAREGDPGSRVLLGGLNVYLQGRFAPARWLPRFAKNWLDRPGLLRWLARFQDVTSPSELGRATIEALRGSDGKTRGEIAHLAEALTEEERPQLFLLSNALLLGLAHALRERFRLPVLCTLQGEAPFLDALPARYRDAAWALLRERARDAQGFISVSHDYAAHMAQRMQLAPEQIEVAWNGIELDGLLELPGPAPQGPPVVGFLSRLREDKGLPLFVEAFVRLRARGRVPEARMIAGGASLRSDAKLVERLKQRLAKAGLAHASEFRPNLEKEQKQALLREITLLSVPTTYGESFGLYLLEAWAASVPVVQPKHAAFEELLQASGGGLLVERHDAESLAAAWEELLLDRAKARALGRAGRAATLEKFSAGAMARRVARIAEQALERAR